MNSNKITPLKFPDTVRLRTCIFFGCSDYTEAETAFLQMLGVFSEEAAEGHSREISIKINNDCSIELKSKNRGLFLGSYFDGDKAEWVNIFCKLFSEDDFGDIYAQRSYFTTRSEKYSRMNLHHFSRFRSTLCQNQCVCDFMDIAVVRDGYKRSLRFEKGHNVGGLTEIISDEDSSTYIRFKYDKEVFENIDIPFDFAKEQLRRLAILNAGVTFNLVYEAGNDIHRDTFVYKGGLREYIEELLSEHEHTEIFEGSCSRTGKDREDMNEYTANLRILFAFCKDKSQINTFHNYNLLTWNGDHTDRVIEKIQSMLNKNGKDDLTQEEIKNHLVLIVVTNTQSCWSRWKDSWQRSIRNDMLACMASHTIDRIFEESDDKERLVDTVLSWIYEERKNKT